MKKDSEQPESAGAVSSTRLLGRWLKPSEAIPVNGQQILMKQDRGGGIMEGYFLDDDSILMTEKRKAWIMKSWGTFEKYREMNPRFKIDGRGSHPWEHTEYWFGIPDPPCNRPNIRS